MEKSKIIDLLKDHNKEDAEKFAAYIIRLTQEKDKQTGKPKNPWILNRTEIEMAELFRRVANEGLVFDGIDITLQSTGISYNYQAYKNKMLLAYPESKVDVSLVYKGDEFSVAKESGSVIYSHKISNPFTQKAEEIIGGYCVIQNKRGEFLTVMSPDDIAQHRKVAKTDSIWKQWPKEMALKTIIKKACGKHFKDIYKNIEEMDNDNYDLEIPLSLDLKWKQEIEAISDLETLRVYWMENRGRGKEFDKYVTMRKDQILTSQKKDAE